MNKVEARAGVEPTYLDFQRDPIVTMNETLGRTQGSMSGSIQHGKYAVIPLNIEDSAKNSSFRAPATYKG